MISLALLRIARKMTRQDCNHSPDVKGKEDSDESSLCGKAEKKKGGV